MMLQEVIKHIDLSDFRTFRNIQEELETKYNLVISDRQWRQAVEEYNQKHFLKHGGRGIYIAGTSRGYIRTYRKEFIQENLNRKFKTAINVLKQCKQIEYALGKRENERLFNQVDRY